MIEEKKKVSRIRKLGCKSVTYYKRRALEHGIRKTVYGDAITIRKHIRKAVKENENIALAELEKVNEDMYEKKVSELEKKEARKMERR